MLLALSRNDSHSITMLHASFFAPQYFERFILFASFAFWPVMIPSWVVFLTTLARPTPALARLLGRLLSSLGSSGQ